MQLRNPARRLIDQVVRDRSLYEAMVAGIGYGPAQWESGLWVSDAPGYYWVLAGIVDRTGARRVFEAGAHFGGSALAMAEAGAEVFTCDVRPEGLAVAGDHERVTALHAPVGDAVAACAETWGRVDLAFVDIDHEEASTLAAIDGVLELEPSWLVVDDVRLSTEMRRVWAAVVDRFGMRSCVDTDDVDGELRGSGVGFGVVRC